MIGTNEIESFNKTLNEMLVVWNNGDNTSPSSGSSSTSSSHTLTQSQLDMNINSIISGGSATTNNSNAFLSMPLQMPQLSNSNSKVNQRDFLTSSQQLDSFLFENNNQGLFSQSTDSNGKLSANDEVTKVIREISRDNKEFQPIEIIPIKSLNKATDQTNVATGGEYTYEPSPVKPFGDFSQINLSPFAIDPSKLEELRSNTSVLDPLFSLPYNTSNPSYIPTISTPTALINSIAGGGSGGVNTINNISYSGNNAIVKPTNTSGSSIINLTKQETNNGPIRHVPLEQYKDKDASLPKSMETDKSGANQGPHDKKDVKRQKRLMKNRESAHLSRQRKRERLTELEHRVEELTHNSSSLTKALSGLESENLVLKAEVDQLVDVIKDSPVLSALFFSLVKNDKTAMVY
ncbi:hypothetical protein SAMD00019534_106600 [Acytostelium subglobosum LB1]|uniref:hypothetical protein n=1 Tax=Acytostelium subglobosum LB1 TaxID=1410327 RepID=UPI00064484B6|nr:hypothetical protein SAMD00019534_106600 [Acytostelium subglobosum LB1]GAM27484.1 hypothetical protein SAMD00019534_106600 [Acytostelium subglobosum LB1]|eukprot:XP_012749549.1 hypothetical protein SAMD00019534_106600 [Acytostelium subglobosum LB1]